MYKSWPSNCSRALGLGIGGVFVIEGVCVGSARRLSPGVSWRAGMSGRQHLYEHQ